MSWGVGAQRAVAEGPALPYDEGEAGRRGGLLCGAAPYEGGPRAGELALRAPAPGTKAGGGGLAVREAEGLATSSVPEPAGEAALWDDAPTAIGKCGGKRP